MRSGRPATSSISAAAPPSTRPCSAWPAAGDLRRIDRGLYDRPRTNKLTGRAAVPDYRAIIRAVLAAIGRAHVVDGMTAANDLGLTTAVPARIEVLVDARLKPIKLGTQVIHFKYAAPSRLYWADRPGMRVVQALHWMQDMLRQKGERIRASCSDSCSHLLDDPGTARPFARICAPVAPPCRSGCRSSCVS